MASGNPYPYRRRPYGRVDTRRRRVISGVPRGAPVTPPPIVVTIGVNAINATSANVIGSVNPNGSATSWWVVYGTTLPLSGAGAIATTPTSIGNGTTGVTVTQEISGLVTNVTYYAAVVGQSAAGTVYGESVAFVPQIQAPTTVPPTPFGQPSVTIPHFNVPFSIITTATQNGAAVVEQDTVEEILANVRAVVLCEIGECPQLSSFGRPSTTFQQGPPDTTELIAAIQLWEPRASETAVSQLLPDGETWNLNLSTSFSGTQNA